GSDTEAWPVAVAVAIRITATITITITATITITITRGRGRGRGRGRDRDRDPSLPLTRLVDTSRCGVYEYTIRSDWRPIYRGASRITLWDMATKRSFLRNYSQSES